MITKAEVLSTSTINDRVKKEQISNMFVPQMKDFNLGHKFELLCYDYKIS